MTKMNFTDPMQERIDSNRNCKGSLDIVATYTPV
jgi:hypothetical protein